MSSPSPPPRQRISRVRTGCLRCRVRKKKCDEKRPICRACERNGFVCQWPSRPSASRQRSRSRSASPIGDGRPGSSSSDSSSDASPTNPESGAHLSSALHESAAHVWIPEADDVMLACDSALGQIPPFDFVADLACVPASPAWQPAGDSAFDGQKAALLEYYLHRTAESLSNGFHSANPFITQLIPAAFSSDLILQLILTQSAAHRAVQSGSEDAQVSKSLYSSSIQRFQHSINEYVAKPETDPLPLVLGTLIMCYTETTRGDINGTLFDHLLACPSLLMHCLSSMSTRASGALPDFLVEYYFYTASVSMISLDADLGSQNLIHRELEDRAQMLVSSNYSGNLCGCWLEVLLILPKIYNLGRELRQEGLSADTMASYTTIHRQILEWKPPVAPDSRAWIVAQTYRHAALLYLYTAVGSPKQGLLNRHNMLVQMTVDQALAVLGQLPVSDRMNTSMCWPLAVIGSCLFDSEKQALIESRLETMSATIGLGNMKQTLRLLRRIWRLPATEGAGPWCISKAMQTHQIWISLA